MTESNEPTTQSVPVVSGVHTDGVHTDRDRRLHRALAWVGIVTGVVFTVAVVFFSGFALGRSSGYHGGNRSYQGQMGPGGDADCPMMRNGSQMGPGMMGPGMMGPGGMDPDDRGPGDRGPGTMRPGQSPTGQSPAPAPPQR